MELRVFGPPAAAPCGQRIVRGYQSHWILVALMPWLLSVVDPTWYFNVPQSLDPWLYHGFLRYYSEYVSQVFRDTYYGSRAAWLIPGHMLYRMLPAWHANFVAHVGLLSVSSLALYGVLDRLIGGRRALLPTLAFSTSAPILVAIGWDYVDGAVITYSLILIYSEVRGYAATGTWQIVTGVAYAGMVHSNIAAMLLAPATFVLAGFGDDVGLRWRTTLRRSLSVLAGFFGGTLLLGVCSRLLGGPFWFFMSSLTWILHNTAGPNRWRTPGWAWLLNAAWLVVPAGGMLAATVVLTRRRDSVVYPIGHRIAVSYLLAVTTFVAFDVWNGALLQTMYYASWLLAPSFVLIGVVVNSELPERTGPRLVLASTALAILLLPYRLVVRSLFAELISKAGVPAVVPVCIVMVGAVVVGTTNRTPRLGAALLCIAFALNTLVYMERVGYPPKVGAPELFAAVDRALEVVHPFAISERPYFWTGGRPEQQDFRVAITSVYLHDYTLLGSEFPKLPKQNLERLGKGSIVVVLSDREDARERAVTGLADLGMTTEVLETTWLHSHNGPCALVVLRIIARRI
jgi:hypothetical protein